MAIGTIEYTYKRLDLLATGHGHEKISYDNRIRIYTFSDITIGYVS